MATIFEQAYDGEWIDLPTNELDMSCCDCGLVPNIVIRRNRKGKLQIQFFRDNRATTRVRKSEKEFTCHPVAKTKK